MVTMPASSPIEQTPQHAQERQIKIEATDVSFSYGETEILQRISLQIREGEFVVLMGPSGSGKSTFLRLLAGLSTPQTGTVQIAGQPIGERISDELAVVFQDYSLFPWLTAEANLVLALKQKLKKTKSKKELQALATQYLELVQLGHATQKYPGEMSGGMRQRAAIARALSLGTDLILMDEPFGALDPITRIQLQELVLTINQQQNRTIVFVTHDAEEAIFLADRIILFSPGPPGVIAHNIEVPFKKPRNRKALFESADFIAFRDDILQHMNEGILAKLQQANRFTTGEGI